MPESEDDLLARAEQELKNSLIKAIAGLKCEIKDGKILITGNVATYYLKQMAQEKLIRIGIPVENRVVVKNS